MNTCYSRLFYSVFFVTRILKVCITFKAGSMLLIRTVSYGGAAGALSGERISDFGDGFCTLRFGVWHATRGIVCNKLQYSINCSFSFICELYIQSIA